MAVYYGVSGAARAGHLLTWLMLGGAAICLFAVGAWLVSLRQVIWPLSFVILVWAVVGCWSVLANRGRVTLSADSRIKVGRKPFELANLADIEWARSVPHQTLLRFRGSQGTLTTLYCNVSAEQRGDFIEQVRQRNPSTAVRRHESVFFPWEVGTLEWPLDPERMAAAMRCTQTECLEEGAYRCHTCGEIRCRAHLYSIRRGGSSDEWAVCGACIPRFSILPKSQRQGPLPSLAETVGPGCSQLGCAAWRADLRCGSCNRSYCVLHVEWVTRKLPDDGVWRCQGCVAQPLPGQ